MQQTTLQATGVAKAAPMTQREMTALHMQRAELKEQLTVLNRRRNQLTEQKHGLSPDAARDFDLRIREIDQRASEIDRTLMRLDREIANGLTQPLVEDRSAQAGQVTTATTQPPPPPMTQTDRLELAVSTGAMLLIGGFAVYLGVRRFFTKPNTVSLEGQARRLDQLQQSIDVIALEMERMSESQRFVAKVLNEKFPAIGAGDAKDAAKR